MMSFAKRSILIRPYLQLVGAKNDYQNISLRVFLPGSSGHLQSLVILAFLIAEIQNKVTDH